MKTYKIALVVYVDAEDDNVANIIAEDIRNDINIPNQYSLQTFIDYVVETRL